MAEINSLSDISRVLYLRGMHRTARTGSIGIFSGFLSGLVLIRIAADLFMIIDLALRGGSIDASGSCGAFLVYLSAYLILAGSTAAYSTGCALPKNASATMTPGGNLFRRNFIRQAVLLRPFNVIVAVIAASAVVLFSLLGGNPVVIFGTAVFTAIVSASGFVLVLAIALKTEPSGNEIRIMEFFFLLVLVMLNPDVGRINEAIAVYFRNIPLSFSTFGEIIVSESVILASAVALLLLLKLINTAGSFIGNGLNFGTAMNWYLRFFRIRYWIVLYFLISPFIFSPFIEDSSKKWAFILFIIFNTLSFLFFIIQCESQIRKNWRFSILNRRNYLFFIKPFFIHLILMIIPGAGLAAGIML